MRLAVTGDRNWDELDIQSIMVIRSAIQKLQPSFLILGDSKGVDTIALQVARKLKIKHHVHIANWKEFGRAAGPIRNRAMLDDGVTHVIYFHHNLSESKGTKNCVEQARKRGLIIIDGKGVGR